MAGEEDMEDDDDDDVDFNPYLQRSPSADRESGQSSKRVAESDDAEEEVGVVEKQDGTLATDCAPQEFRGSEQFVGALDSENKFFELASDDYKEKGFEDVEQEELLRGYDFGGGSNSVKYSTKIVFKGKDREYFESRLNGINYGGKTCGEENVIGNQNSDGSRKPLHGKDCSVSAGKLLYETENKVEEDATVPFLKIGKQLGENLGSERSDGEGEGTMDAVCKRTRARYSLADMSLDQLETFLQESDEDEYFQTMNDEEEYRKFLVAVQDSEDAVNKKPEQIKTKGEEDDEEEDVDFEIEIEEALENDDISGSLRKRKQRRPERREKRRQRARFQTKGPLLGQSIVPLRHLLPHVSNLVDDAPLIDKRKSMTEAVNRVWPSNAKRKSPVNGFTAHQIGQLYCLIHEHVQLLVQVFSLCILEPARQKMAMDTHHMLMELVEKRELLLSWKKTAFPDFCFRPPYTRPSLTEDGGHVTCFDNLTPDTSKSTSTSCGQSTRVSSNVYPGSYFRHGSSCDPIFSSSDNLGQTSPMLARSYSMSRTVEPAAHHYGQHTAGSSETWQETVQPFAAWRITPDQRQKTTLAEGMNPSQIKNPAEASCCAVTGPSMVDSTSLPTNPLDSADDLFHSGSHGPYDDPTSLTARCYHSSSVSSSEHAPVEVVLLHQSKPGAVHPEPLPPAIVQTATWSEGAQMCVSLPSVLGDQVKLGWAPVTSGPVRSLLDVAPLALVRDYLMDVSHVVQEYRQRHVETGGYHGKCEREPLFVKSDVDEQDQSIGKNQIEGTRSCLLGGADFFADCIPRRQIKKTMAAALMESTKKQSLALVPKDAAIAVQRFLPYFNKLFFPHKPPPVATASRLLFTDAEDELLAMGLMMYNTDWKAIQQRFLPSKSMHQIFVRQKNRSSARAPENSIKLLERHSSVLMSASHPLAPSQTVRRMKSSPLTHSEKTCIEEGLGMFKYDWNKVWEYCVPHRDPAVLPRQWRIAVGTQKSYKTSETSKERRRIYEANRRQRIAAKKTSDTTVTAEEDSHPFNTGGSVDENDYKTASKDADDSDIAYIREAFLDDWCPRSTAIVASPPAGAERQRKLISSLSKKWNATAELELRLSRPSLWLNSQTVKATSEIRKRTVKLAPGLPSLKLPPQVQVLSQSQQPFPFATRLPPVTFQRAQVTSQGPDKLEIPVQATPFSTSLSDCGTEITPMQEGGSVSHQSTKSSIHSLYRQGQIKVAQATWAPNAQTGLTIQGPTQVSKKYSIPEQFPLLEKNQSNHPLLKPNGDLTLANDVLSQSCCLRDSMSLFLQNCPAHQYPPFLRELIGSGLPHTQKLDSLAAQSREDIAVITSTDQLGSDYQDQTASYITPLLVPFESVFFHAPQLCSATTPSATYPGGELVHSSLSGPIKTPPSTADYQLHCKGVPPANDLLIPDAELQLNLNQTQVGKRNALECAEQGDLKVRRNPTKRNKRVVYGNKRETQDSNQGIASSSATVIGSWQLRPNLGVEGICSDLSTSSRQSRGRVTGRSHSRKSQKVHEACVERGSQEPHLEQHIIVMEQEELSDSEDEPGAGVEFEHEEMGDSDKEVDVELRSVKHDEACKAR